MNKLRYSAHAITFNKFTTKIMNSMKIKLACLALSCVVISACGGGDDSTKDDTHPAPTKSSVEGVYEGTTSNGKNFDLIVLDGGTAWALYGVRSGGILYTDGVISSLNAFDDGSKYSSPSVRDYLASGEGVSGTLEASYTSGGNITGTIAYANGQISNFSGARPASVYSYDSPALVSSIVGDWPGFFLTGEGVTLRIDSIGNLTGKSAVGCSLSGTIKPRVSGKNVFDVTGAFGGPPCALPNQTFTGNAVSYPAGGKNQLVIAATTVDRLKGNAFIGTR